MLFQASALAQISFDVPAKTLMAPALGRVAPVTVNVEPGELEPIPLTVAPETRSTPLVPEALPPGSTATFWPLVKVEALEALLLLSVQGLALVLPAWVAGVSPLRLWTGAWMYVLPYLFSVSWCLFMVPLVLTGQSPLMGVFGVTLPEPSPERRMAFSLVHLLSVACFPVSFLCLLLGPRHQTLSEMMSGQELISRPVARLRG
jgi:hypothetical protein